MALAPAACGKGGPALNDWFFVASTAAAAGVIVWVVTGEPRPPVLERLMPQGAQKAAGRPVLHAFSEKLASRRIGALLKEYAEKTHPQLIFSDVVALCLLGVLAGGLAGALFLPAGPMTLFAAAAGPLAADRILLKMHGRRSARISQQLPQALQIQTSALRAGNSLVQSLRGVAQRARAPLADEVARAVREIDLGVPQETALQQLASRIGGREGQLWVNAMIIHKATGGNLTVVADSLGRRLRERLDLSREVRALTAQARLSGIVVAAAPLLFLVILSASAPQMKVLYETPAGWGLLTAGLLLELVGFVWIKWALRVKA